MKFQNEYILYIYVRDETKREADMAVANLNNIDDKLKAIYNEQVTTNQPQGFVDKSELLFEQMNFIAFNNRQALNLI